jgi:hypothetical protein
MKKTALYELLAARLGTDPVADMGRRREQGASWRAISIAYLQEHDVSVTDLTLRNWYSQATQPA